MALTGASRWICLAWLRLERGSGGVEAIALRKKVVTKEYVCRLTEPFGFVIFCGRCISVIVHNASAVFLDGRHRHSRAVGFFRYFLKAAAPGLH